MRVTDGMRQTATREAQSLAVERLQRATQQAVSGKRVQAPQDDPAGFARITQNGASVERWQSRTSALSLAQVDGAIAKPNRKVVEIG